LNLKESEFLVFSQTDFKSTELFCATIFVVEKMKRKTILRILFLVINLFQYCYNFCMFIKLLIFCGLTISQFRFKLALNVPALGEVANFGTDYFLSKIKFLARNKREFTTKFAILPNACYSQWLLSGVFGNHCQF
jgi:hypothetical protein